MIRSYWIAKSIYEHILLAIFQLNKDYLVAPQIYFGSYSILLHPLRTYKNLYDPYHTDRRYLHDDMLSCFDRTLACDGQTDTGPIACTV